MNPDVSQDLEDLNSTLTTIEKVVDVDDLKDQVRELEAQASDPSLWDDPDHAQQVTSKLSHVQAQIKKVTTLRQRVDDMPVMYELADDATEAGDTDAARSNLSRFRRCCRGSTTSVRPSLIFGQLRVVWMLRTGRRC